MGNGIGGEISQGDLEEYSDLLYLKKSEIIHIYKRFRKLDPPSIKDDREYRIPKERLLVEFPELLHNPFLDRIFAVFSSKHDDRFSFDDLLDLCSALSRNCPTRVKALWAYKIFDFNNDNTVNKDDLIELIKRLTLRAHTKDGFNPDDMEFIANAILKDMDLDNTNEITSTEFAHAASRLSEFSTSFSLKF